MKVEQISITNFRCFGRETTTFTLQDNSTVFIGSNGSGKTAAIQALSRLFGVTSKQRQVRKTDFHIEHDKDELASGSTLSIDVILSFPGHDEPDGADTIPEFFQQMAVETPGGDLKARIILKAKWIDDGTPLGSVEEDIRWAPRLTNNFDWEKDCTRVQASERSRIQLIYIPAHRNISEQVTNLIKSRFWQAAKWSDEFRNHVEALSKNIQASYANEAPAKLLLEKLSSRWKQVHDADTDTDPRLKLIDSRFERIIQNAGFTFFPNEFGQERDLADLSDGQKSLFHIALTAATLEAELAAIEMNYEDSPFDHDKMRRVCLTLLAIEEPENSLSPFFLSRIIEQALEIGSLDAAQVLISSHSASIISRLEPENVRYFRLDRSNRTSSVQKILLPEDDEEASKFIRLAVKAYPEIYFARCVILGEGASEEIVIPRLAEAMGFPLDPSFVPVVPLGGRYCVHFWKLLSDLKIPFVTLLDLDAGRSHGGAKLVQGTADRLDEMGIDWNSNSVVEDRLLDPDKIDTLEDADIWYDFDDNDWLNVFEAEGVYFSDPLDIDFAMLLSFPEEYKIPNPGGRGPRNTPESIENAKIATLKTDGDSSLYEDQYDDTFRWYPYLFLNNKSKPETHIKALSKLSKERLSRDAPRELKALVSKVINIVMGSENGHQNQPL
ncbi:ATP-dependent nuclease [Saccharophagus degradans]|uniref:ATP-dependent endonuclease of the OLD family n=1 Tax=Saccharophagus degradans (strain 2-40 / ATCC 43961 / DSM 17024) TaxID=203122 RepID=Q21PB9_SACD2|nr:AAA family ATPase [Saccharophagus degradans]ABD79460.1 ATP-dependent endonuclease of the OLD family [Saccharophagus degradans 2-40]